ncbi:hypothetical protein O7626_07010 [Micromonospora sp. WMMD1102]|uniref:hypothetical protein n=1 Tax=Micromonospora sp. WMMD1102 TaxID=3016105 RepID=UPI0024154F81|nr:hypothetical protein [Micromonospora sp. WMMD1102]MDG4785682.1 hypothetical protein [Micromonospora sp. WMMD1102]
MDTQTELSELIRAMARQDWGTIDRLLDDLRQKEWAGATQVIAIAFALAVHRRFQPSYDLREITNFVTETRSRYQDGKELPALALEGLIRAALGEADLMDEISPEVALPGQIVILGTLLQEEIQSEAQLEKFVQDVEKSAADFT